MTQAIQTPSTSAPPQTPDIPCSALDRCCKAYQSAFNKTMARKQGEPSARFDASIAYCEAMPPLLGKENIRDFIACTAHGMLIGAIDGADGARLLYAAQVANSTIQMSSRTPKS